MFALSCLHRPPCSMHTYQTAYVSCDFSNLNKCQSLPEACVMAHLWESLFCRHKILHVSFGRSWPFCSTCHIGSRNNCIPNGSLHPRRMTLAAIYTAFHPCAASKKRKYLLQNPRPGSQIKFSGTLSKFVQLCCQDTPLELQAGELLHEFNKKFRKRPQWTYQVSGIWWGSHRSAQCCACLKSVF